MGTMNVSDIHPASNHSPHPRVGSSADDRAAADVTYAVMARGLVKRYGDTTALAGIDLDVPTGTVTAVLGPNGAGKTTAVRILATLADPDEGRAEVAGFDVLTEPTEVRRRIGLAAQDATVDPLLTGRENLVMLGELHQMSRRAARDRAVELLEQFSLTEAADRVTSGYSGGMRRRLDLAATLIARPAVLFLDEPTTGLDPRARTELWSVIDMLVGQGTTVLLTTQYLDEAERLADDIVVIDRGRIIARGDARTLKKQVGGDHVHVVVVEARDLPRATHIVARICGRDPDVDLAARSATAPTAQGVEGIVAIAAALADAGIAVEDLSLRQPTLDEVFLTLTGSAPVSSDEPENRSEDRSEEVA
jgi:ABC-2 type transport system ATP-binding protein